METNLYSCIRTGRTISEKTMEDGNLTGIRDEKIAATSLANLYGERPPKLTANGHDFGGESSSPGRPPANAVHDDKNRKRINPLRIHLGKRPFVDNSIQYYNANKKRKLFVNKHNDSSAPTNTPRVPKLIPKRIHYQNIASHVENNVIDHEQNKPVPRLVPKSQLSHYKKGKVEKEPQLKEYAESLGLQPMVKFKCRKCCSMSFKTLAMLKEHQKICRAQAKEPAHSPEAPPNVAGSDANTSGPNRVTRKVYLCSACGTYYENWNLFLHMREIHNRHICLFCLGMFSKAEKLSTHLTNKHSVKEFNYESKEDFFNVYNGTLYLMCCVCDEICSEQDDFFNHDCNNIKPKPVPVLVSKNAAKSNIVKSSSNPSELSVNGPPSVVKDYSKSVSDKKDIKEGKLEMLPSQILKPVIETKTPDITSSTSMNTDTSAALLKEVNNAEDSGMELEGSDRPASSPVNWHSYSADKNSIKNTFSNGDENADHTDDSDSHISDGNDSPLRDPLPAKPIDKPCLPIEKEKETGGIKLKLSLNNANSPVIINSTVDPTIGQSHHKPTRSRRPPKRYEKVPQPPVPEPVIQPKTPSIKMTICDRADSPFVKTTIYEDNKVETTIKSIMNNNLESQTPEHKPESAIKTTIYDNKPEDDDNTLNRVPKLTVRVPKELLDKDSSSDYSSDSDMSEKLTVDENNVTIEEDRELKEEMETGCAPTETFNQLVEDVKDEAEPDVENVSVTDEQVDFKTEVKTEPPETEIKPEPVVEEPSLPVTELALNRPLDKYPMKELLRVFLASTVYSCIYCNHVRKIAVNCEQLSLHMVAQHRFSATVDSITAEELMPETITAKLQVGAQELTAVYMNLDSYDSEEKNENISYEHIFECFQCFFKTAIHKDLCLHNRKMHQKTILLCVMCKTNFLSYSELLCHICPGTYDSEYEIKFRCCLCNVDQIPSQFRLMVHLRKIHHTCDVCLEFCHNQARLSNHVWKHKLHHMCYRCGIAYRNKLDINNHLFWKHGTESVLCKKCMQKKWPHVYHFCSPPAVFACDECNLQFTKAVCLKVHKRIHSEEFPHECTEEGCSEKFVSKKLLNKHVNEHKKKLLIEELNEAKPSIEPAPDATKESIPTIDLVDENPAVEPGTSIVKDEPESEQHCKKNKKKKLKDKDALLLDVNLPALNLSESDSSDESDSEVPPPPLSPLTTTITTKEEIPEDKPNIETDEQPVKSDPPVTDAADVEPPVNDDEAPPIKTEHKLEPVEEEKPNEQQVLDIWDNFKKYQAKVEKQKTPPLVPIKKHVCESDHDYCLIPTDMNGDNNVFGLDRKKNKKSPRKGRGGGGGGGGLSSSSSSSSDSDSSCSCGSNCSCSSSSGSSSSSSSDSDSSDESGNEKKKPKRIKRTLPDRRISTGSNVDVMGMSETPVLVPPQVAEPPIAESDLETDESDTDEEFYDENPQSFANKLHEEKLNQLMQGPPAEPPDAADALGGGGAEPEAADLPVTPVKEEEPVKEEPKPEPESFDKPASAKKKSKKKKKSKSSKKHGPIKINIPKDVIGKSESEAPPPLVPNKITISLHSNTVQLPETPKAPPAVAHGHGHGHGHGGSSASTLSERKRASKRRRVPNKFYGYSSDEEGAPQTPTTMAALKPQQPPKLEWRKEDLPSPMPHKAKKEVPAAAPSTPLSSKLSLSLSAVRLTAPVPDPEPPRLLMNSELESNESDSSSEGGAPAPPFPPPTYLTTGTSSLPYAFQRPAARAAREGESVYCYCRCPYDEVSEMIACDAEGCPIEWFHFECVGIMVPPKGKWYCPECRKNQIFSGYR